MSFEQLINEVLDIHNIRKHIAISLENLWLDLAADIALISDIHSSLTQHNASI